MSFCENCGIQLNDGANFCRECGKPTGGGTPQGQANNQPQNAYQPQSFSSQQSHSSVSNMSVWQGFVNGWKKFVVMKGRARRTEYWGWILFINIFSIPLLIIDLIFGFKNFGFSGIFSLAIIIPGITITVRRLHDIGRSGSSYFWLGFAPGIVLSIIIVIAIVNFFNGYFYSSNFYNIETMLQYLRYNSGLLFFFILTLIWSFVGGIILFVYCCMDSTQGENQYGPNPKWESSQT